MTDQEKLLALLAEFKLEPSTSSDWAEEPDADKEVVLEADKGGVQGYSRFVCIWRFNDDGSFASVGVWE